MNTSNEQRLSSNDDLFFKDCFTEVDEGKVDAEFNNVSMNCFNSKNNKFSMDSDGNLVVNSITSNEKNTTGLTIDDIYPLGSIYMSVNPTNPGTLFGGTWEKWGTGRTPVCMDPSQSEFDTVEKTGGSKYLQAHTHTGTTGVGFTSFLRMVWGTMVDREFSNHIGSSGDNSYRDLENTDQFPGGNHFHTFTTDNTGEGDSGNLQPYITCYMWKRVA